MIGTTGIGDSDSSSKLGNVGYNTVQRLQGVRRRPDSESVQDIWQKSAYRVLSTLDVVCAHLVGSWASVCALDHLLEQML
jgi:hypothetical protein